jgi:hypothetical protein
MRSGPVFMLVFASALVLSACGGTAGGTSDSPSAAASVAAAATPVPIGSDLGECGTGSPCHCTHESPCDFAGGTYTTFGRWAFLPGLTMAIPAGWTSTEQDAGEFNLLHSKYGQGGLFFWRDMIPVNIGGDQLVDVPSTPQALTDWFTANPNLTVSEPESVIIGRDITATTFTFTTAPGVVNPNQDPNCPDYPPGAAVCFPLITDPVHWGGNWDTASAHATRLYLASIGPDPSPHLLLVAVLGTIESPSTETDPFVELERIEAAIQPILDSLDVSTVTFN